MRSLKWALTQHAECLCKRQLGNRQLRRKTTWRQREETAVCTKKGFRGNPPCWLRSWTPGLQNSEKFNLLLKQCGLSYFAMATPGGSDGKERACNAGDLGSIPGSGRSPGGRHGSPLQYACLENPHGQDSLTSYSPWGRKESDVTERLGAHAAHGQPWPTPLLSMQNAFILHITARSPWKPPSVSP